MKPIVTVTLLAISLLPARAFDPVKLPDGRDFQTWEIERPPGVTFHVAQNNPVASDENDGSEDRPWKTISRAAAVLQPGERVQIHAGLYREWVKPARGGTAPDKMISYESAPGEEVVITGNDVWTPKWEKTKWLKPIANVTTWQAEISPKMFERANTFALQLFPVQANDEVWKNFRGSSAKRGMMFANGEIMKQMLSYTDLQYEANSFWVEPDGMTIHARFPNDLPPEGFAVELTTREQVFAPTEFYLNYIRISGLKLMHAANGVPIPEPQRGLVSTSLGNHWIIEDCEIGHAATLGIDCGSKWWGPDSYRLAQDYGFHIIRRNSIHDCGISSISGWFDKPNRQLLIEDNLVEHCATLPLDGHCESAGMKLHYLQDSIIRRNVIMDSGYTAGLWLDSMCNNTRITQNLISQCKETPFGAIFTEITYGPNLIDNNIVLGSAKHGIYSHDAARNVLANNLVANGKGTAIFLSFGDPARVLNGNPKKGYDNDQRICGNILTGFENYIRIPNYTATSADNLFGGMTGKEEEAFSCLAHGGKVENMTYRDWKTKQYDPQGKFQPIRVEFDPQTLTLKLNSPAAIPVFPSAPVIKPVATLDYVVVEDAFISPKYQKTAEVAPLNVLLTEDFLGRKRDPAAYQIGPLLNPSTDGSPLKIDPRKLRPEQN